MSRPRLLDLFCGAGGAAKGYADAGFEVVGVDIEPQPHYPFEFFQADALMWLQGLVEGWLAMPGLAVIHASPPCQFATDYGRRPGHVKPAKNLIPATRELLEGTGLHYIIENVEKARPHLLEPVRLCGSSFGLDVRRHRLFEASWPLFVPPCDHSWQTPRFPAATNREPNSRRTVEIGVWRISLDVQQRAMGIDWMTREELSQAIPPAYTQHIGGDLAAQLRADERAVA